MTLLMPSCDDLKTVTMGGVLPFRFKVVLFKSISHDFGLSSNECSREPNYVFLHVL